jgi:hypothetical protein
VGGKDYYLNPPSSTEISDDESITSDFADMTDTDIEVQTS